MHHCSCRSPCLFLKAGAHLCPTQVSKHQTWCTQYHKIHVGIPWSRSQRKRRRHVTRLTWNAKLLMPACKDALFLGATCLGKRAWPLPWLDCSMPSTWGLRVRRWARGALSCASNLAAMRKMPRAPAPASEWPKEDLADIISTASKVSCGIKPYA